MMPNKKKAKNFQPQPQLQTPASTPEPRSEAPPSFGQSHRNLEEEIAGYSEVQRNEFLTTRAIYPDEFKRIHGRKDAWKVRRSTIL